MKLHLSTLVAASTLALLAACGGGGSDAPTPTGVKISSANQTSAARAGVNTGLSVAMAQGALGSGAAVAPAAAGRAHALASLVRQAVDGATRKSAASLGAHPAVLSSASMNCAVGGTVSSSFDDKDGNLMVSAGDVISATFSQCRNSTTNTVNGAVVITIAANPVVTGSTSQLSVNAQFQALAIVDDGSSYTVNGSVAVAETDNDVTTNTVVTVGTGGLSLATAFTGYNDDITLGAGLTVTSALADDGSFGSVSVAGTVTSSLLGGPVTIATPVALSGPGADAYPSTGQMLITGASGSKVRLTVLDNTQVKLELDADGDGTFESSSTVAWSTLVA